MEKLGNEKVARTGINNRVAMVEERSPATSAVNATEASGSTVPIQVACSLKSCLVGWAVTSREEEAGEVFDGDGGAMGPRRPFINQ